MRAATRRAAAASAARYERRRPEQTPLHRLVREHHATFAAEVDHAGGGVGLPPFVKDEFDAYLDCGILAHGFLRLTCDTCARDTLVAFSCPPRGPPSGRKRRGICPACGTWRMAETAGYLVDNILPRVPVRQWVLSFPIPLRSLFAVHPELLTPVLGILHRAIHTHLVKQTGVKRDDGASGAIILIQRFGSAAGEGAPAFMQATAPTQAQLQTLLDKIIRRVMRLLTRLGHDGIAYLARSGDIDPDNIMAPLQAASTTWRIAMGPGAGRKVLTLVGPGELRAAQRSRELCARQHAWIHAYMQACAARPMTGRASNNYVATSRARRSQTKD